MPHLRKGRYLARTARTAADLACAQELRWRSFRARSAGGGGGSDDDAFDARCSHLLVEDEGAGRVVATCRLLALPGGAAIGETYAAQYYDLSALARYPHAMVEVGRFCVDPASRDADVLRLAWAALTQIVDDGEMRLMFGCTSFRGTDACAYRDAFAFLGREHGAPARWAPAVKAPQIVRFAAAGTSAAPALLNPRRAFLAMPPLLRTYLRMGGWVSDHAVIDRELDTLHVFTAVDVAKVPAARARALRRLAG